MLCRHLPDRPARRADDWSEWPDSNRRSVAGNHVRGLYATPAQSGTRGRTRTCMSLVRSEVPESIRRHASTLDSGAGGESRTRLNGLEARGTAAMPRPLTSLAEPVGVEPTRAGFGDQAVAATRLCKLWGERRESNPLTAGSQPAPAPFGFAHHDRRDSLSCLPAARIARTSAAPIWSFGTDSNRHHLGYKPSGLPLAYRSDHTGAPGEIRTRDLLHTRQAFCLWNYRRSYTTGAPAGT